MIPTLSQLQSKFVKIIGIVNSKNWPCMPQTVWCWNGTGILQSSFWVHVLREKSCCLDSTITVQWLTVAPWCWASCTAASTRLLSPSLGRAKHVMPAMRSVRRDTTLSHTLSCTHNTHWTWRPKRQGEEKSRAMLIEVVPKWWAEARSCAVRQVQCYALKFVKQPHISVAFSFPNSNSKNIYILTTNSIVSEFCH